MKVVIASGYFDPLHVGHIEYFALSRKLGDRLVVIVNNDYQAALKKGRYFMPAVERSEIVRNLRTVDEVVLSVDRSPYVSNTLKKIRDLYKNDSLIFAKGGDRTRDNIPESETSVCIELGIELVTGLGNKIQSSSELIKKSRL